MASRTHRRTAWATGLSLVLHALALTGMVLGLRVLGPPPEGRALEVRLISPPRPPPRPEPVHRASGPADAAAPLPAAPAPQRPAEAPIAAPSEPSAQASSSGNCEPEDLPLLTEAEKARCRNQIDADRERRLARSADERAAKQVAEAQRMAPTFRMPTEKEAYYAAVAQAYWLQSHGPPMAGHPPGIGCALPTVPFLGGVEVNKNIFAKKKKEPGPPHSLKLGPLPCYLVPPQGLFTEESGLDPLDPQWRPAH